MPLGAAHTGECRALPDEPFLPPEEAQREFCNRGYARGCCERFPEHSSFDAVRFSMKEESGEIVQVVWVMETNHWPAEHGVMDPAAPCHANEIVARQAAVFIADYLRRAESKKMAATSAML